VESEAEKGSTFHFTIAYDPVKSEEIEVKHEINEIKSKLDKEVLVLVAEDDEVSFLLIESLLSQEKFKIVQANNGQQVITMLKNTPGIDIILMDIRMPKLDGIEATKKIREFNKTVPIIAQTAFALSGDREKAINAGCNEYITKPIKPEKLMGLINKYI
jgi:CheY-like chemotaxis protein